MSFRQADSKKELRTSGRPHTASPRIVGRRSGVLPAITAPDQIVNHLD
jgi:hypothetical protein